MKIGFYSDPQVAGPGATGAQGPRPASPAGPAGAAGAAAPVSQRPQGVAVSVSQQARSLGGATAAAPEFDAAKVEAFKSAIANGTFKINAEAIADKLLGNAQEMLDRVRS